jgi:hypothetical protein
VVSGSEREVTPEFRPPMEPAPARVAQPAPQAPVAPLRRPGQPKGVKVGCGVLTTGIVGCGTGFGVAMGTSYVLPGLLTALGSLPLCLCGAGCIAGAKIV